MKKNKKENSWFVHSKQEIYFAVVFPFSDIGDDYRPHFLKSKNRNFVIAYCLKL